MKSLASERQNQIVTQPETQNSVMIPKEKKVRNDDSDEISNSQSLPHDIIANDILTRLPIDSLMRFKCVCKFWRNLISNDSDFITLYSRRNGILGFIQLLSSYTDDDTARDKHFDKFRKVIKSNGIVLYNIDKKETKVIHFRPETGLLDRKLRIRHSVNGLVLLSRIEDDIGSTSWYFDYPVTHHVFNPVTGYSVQLPVLEGASGKKYFHLAYDALARKYKVVCFYKKKPNFIFKILTVGVESDSWRNVATLSYPRIKDDREAVFANGSLNWLTHDRYGAGCKADQGKVLSLDVSKEKFYAIDYPKGVSDAAKLMEMGGSLCFLDYVPTGTIMLWGLKENEEKQGKTNQHNEWLQYSVKFNILQDNKVPELFNDLENNSCVALVRDPTLKIIYRHTNVRILDEPDKKGFISCTPEIYSYDVGLKSFAFISEDRGIFVKWDLNSLVRLQPTFAGYPQ